MIELRDNWPKYLQVVEIVLRRIREGEYPPGSRIPTVLELMAEFQVSNTVTQKALRELRARGAIYSVGGMGSFVVEDLPEDL